jgi:hypothetical protein
MKTETLNPCVQVAELVLYNGLEALYDRRNFGVHFFCIYALFSLYILCGVQQLQ